MRNKVKYESPPVRLNVLAVGEQGLGKRAFLKEMFQTFVSSSEGEQSNVNIQQNAKFESKGIKRQISQPSAIEELQLQDVSVEFLNSKILCGEYTDVKVSLFYTKDFGFHCTGGIDNLLEIEYFLKSGHATWLDVDSHCSSEKWNDLDCRIHLMFYFFNPYRVSDLDYEAINLLQQYAPVVSICGGRDVSAAIDNLPFIFGCLFSAYATLPEKSKSFHNCLVKYCNKDNESDINNEGVDTNTVISEDYHSINGLKPSLTAQVRNFATIDRQSYEFLSSNSNENRESPLSNGSDYHHSNLGSDEELVINGTHPKNQEQFLKEEKDRDNVNDEEEIYAEYCVFAFQNTINLELDGLKYHDVQEIVEFIFINGGIKLLFEAAQGTSYRLMNEWQSEIHNIQYSPSSLMRSFTLKGSSYSPSNPSRFLDDLSKKLIKTEGTYSCYIFTEYFAKLHEKYLREGKVDHTQWSVVHGVPLTLGVVGGVLAAILTRMTRSWWKASR